MRYNTRLRSDFERRERLIMKMLNRFCFTLICVVCLGAVSGTAMAQNPPLVVH